MAIKLHPLDEGDIGGSFGLPSCIPILIPVDLTDACFHTVESGSAPANMGLTIGATSIIAASVGAYPSADSWDALKSRRYVNLTSYDLDCHTFPCSNGVTVSVDWAYENATGKTQQEAIDDQFDLTVGSSSPTVFSPLQVIAQLRLVSGGNFSGKSIHGTLGSNQNAQVSPSVNRPTVIESGSGTASWTPAEVQAAGEDLYVTLQFIMRGFWTISPGKGAFAQGATVDASITNIAIAFT